ncbi:MAG: RNA polymerase sigma factor FliA [Gammaproteobacteria bacterium]|nr:RNA polymerase sigma factor FliA [Gammaproteobacteria bacterium]
MYKQIQHDERDKLVTEHVVLVKRIAHHIGNRLPSNIQIDDLIQSGMIGLLEASKNYDPSQGASFETYAGIRIRGAILDEVRGTDWTPRSVTRKIRDVSRAVHEVENILGRDSTNSEVAEHMGLSVDEYHTILKDSMTARLFSLEQVEDEHGIAGQSKLPEPQKKLEENNFKQALASEIQKLPEKEQLMMSLYYNDELNLKEIGAVLNVSESRVSQIHGQALIRLRSRLQSWLG